MNAVELRDVLVADREAPHCVVCYQRACVEHPLAELLLTRALEDGDQ